MKRIEGENRGISRREGRMRLGEEGSRKGEVRGRDRKKGLNKG